MSSDNPYAPPDSEVAVEDPIDLASRGARLGGALIDGLLAMAVIFPLMFASGYWQRAMAGEQSVAETIGMGALGFVVFLIMHGYLLAKHGQTIGKRLVKTRIVSIDNQDILPFWKVVSLRYLPVSVISQIPLVGPILTFIDVLFIFRSDKRCVHDLIAGTKVITAE